jgi:hypothetical protein
MKRLFLVLSIIIGLTARLTALPLAPTSYTYLNGYGPYGYLDETGDQLTNGVYNGLIPGINLATPDAYEWVAFGGTGEVSFHFASNVTVQNITISMAQWTPAAVYLPPSITVNSTVFNINAGAFSNMDHAIISLNGSWTGTDLTLYFTYGGQWTFLDEVTFSGVGAGNSVPESGSTMIMAMGAVLGLLAVRSRLRRL